MVGHKLSWMVVLRSCLRLALRPGPTRSPTAARRSTWISSPSATRATRRIPRILAHRYGAVGYDYRIGTYEVTADQWAAVYAADPNVGNAGYWSGSQPTGGISWNEAAKFCNWLTTGNANSGYYTISGGSATPNALSHDAYAAAHGTTYFIPTENEWYKAAYYNGSRSTYYNYPTGRTPCRRLSLAVRRLAPLCLMVMAYPGRPANVNKAGGLSPYGTMGQGGNVWEWNETDRYGSDRGLRGGNWAIDYSAPLASAYRYETTRRLVIPRHRVPRGRGS